MKNPFKTLDKHFAECVFAEKTVHMDKTKIQAKAACIGLYRKFFSTVKNLLCRARRPNRIVKNYEEAGAGEISESARHRG